MARVRSVMVTLEVMTNLPIATLRRSQWWNSGALASFVATRVDVVQAQANVVKLAKPSGRSKKRA